MNDLVRCDDERRLYVLRCDGGFTCRGYDNAYRIALGVKAWCGTDLPLDESAIGTLEGYVQYIAIMQAGEAHHKATGKRCDIELTQQLIGLEGCRVEVITKCGERMRFKVGKSTGWMPCHLELARRTSSGGPSVCGAPFQSVRVIK